MGGLENIKDIICREIDEIGHKNEFSAGDLDAVDKLVHTLKNIYKIEMGYNGGYSRNSYGRYSRDGGNWSATGSYGNSYDGGSSYARGYSNRHYVRGHYSRAEAKDKIMERMEELHNSAKNDQEKEIIERTMHEIESM